MFARIKIYLKANRFSIFIGVILAVALFITTMSLYNNIEEKNNVSDALILNTSDLVRIHFEDYFTPTNDFRKILDQMYEERGEFFTEYDFLEKFSINLISLYPQVNSFIVGDEQGNFFMVKKEADRSISTQSNAVTYLCSPSFPPIAKLIDPEIVTLPSVGIHRHVRSRERRSNRSFFNDKIS